MSLITSALIATSFAAACAASTIATSSSISSRADAARTYEWSAHHSFSAEARRARAQAVAPARQTTPFTRFSLESLT